MRHPRWQEGFTLIELMIVILIIAILVAIAIPVMWGSRSTAQRRTCQANMRTIDGAINTYDALHEAYCPNGDVGTLMVPVLVKRRPVCSYSNSAYTMFGGTSSAPPFITCPTGVTGHTI